MPLIETGATNEDVESDLASFQDLLLPEPIVRALNRAGFRRPSPVQRLAIPLGRFGADLLVQAKSGTGKTLTYGTILTELVSAATPHPQALVLEPTRELALQTESVVTALLSDLPQALSCAAFVGGLPFVKDAQRLRDSPCQIVVGTPGRLRALVDTGDLLAVHIRSVVLDEADSLLAGEGFLADIACIIRALPEKKQVMAFSATYTADILREATAIMRDPQPVLLCPQTTALHGIRQLYSLVGKEGEDGGNVKALRLRALLSLLDRIAFDQAIVFTNDRDWAEEVAAAMSGRGLSAAFLSGMQSQKKRMSVVAAMRRFRLRVLVATDLAARGLDVPQVNLVVNLDLPRDFATYMHRIGRTGRFGKRGVAVSVVTAAELAALQGYLAEGSGGAVEPAPATIPSGWYTQGDPAPLRQIARGGGGSGGDGGGGGAVGDPSGRGAGERGEEEEEVSGAEAAEGAPPRSAAHWGGGESATASAAETPGYRERERAAPAGGGAGRGSGKRGGASREHASAGAASGGAHGRSEGQRPRAEVAGASRAEASQRAAEARRGGDTAATARRREDESSGAAATGWGGEAPARGGASATRQAAEHADDERYRQKVEEWRRMYYSFWWWEMLRAQNEQQEGGGRQWEGHWDAAAAGYYPQR